MNTNRVLAALLVAAPLLALSAPTHAAPSYDACTNFIPSLPAVISTQGVWCLNKDLATAVTSGNAITINTNNVTVDCNGYKLGGLLAGLGTATIGVYANGRSNITVRDCNIRGFFAGVNLEDSSGSSSGHRVERNRFEGNTVAGIQVIGDGSLVRDNLVIDTGGSTLGPEMFSGIFVRGRADVIDNQVVGVDGPFSSGVFAAEPYGSMLRNRVSGIVHPEGGGSFGIQFSDDWDSTNDVGVDVRENVMTGGGADTFSVNCNTDSQLLHGNALLMGPVLRCGDGGDNYGSTIGPL